MSFIPGRPSRALMISLLIAAGAAPAFARSLSPDEALGRAMTEGGIIMSRSSSLKLVYTNTPASRAAAPAYYVFADTDNPDGGFVITSADTRLRPLLGYADDSTFDPTNIPDNLRWWLSQYEDEITAYLATDPAEPLPSRATIHENYAQWDPVSPICTTRWDQNGAYAAMTPVKDGMHCMTGCAATALAQVIKGMGYANSKGMGSKSASPASGTGTTVTFDFDSWEPDFDAMLDEYSVDYNANDYSVQEVAKLMLACGMAQDMRYGTDVSAASSSLAKMRDYFGFDSSSRSIGRGSFQAPQWESIIYHQVSIGRPIYYTGRTTASNGHAFVCDGYSSNGMFHMNWGWSGLSDGYYVLTSLIPGQMGIGSFEGGYNMGQTAYILVVPGTEPLDIQQEASTEPSPINFTFSGNLGEPTITGTTYTFPIYHSVLGNSAGLKMGMGLLLTNDDEEATQKHIYIEPTNWNAINGWAVHNFSINMAGVYLPPNTSWSAVPCYRVEDYDSYWAVNTEGILYDHYDIKVNANGTFTIEVAETRTAGLEIYSFRANDIYASDQSAGNTVEFIVTNYSNRDFCEPISLRIRGGSLESPITLSTQYASIRAGESIQLKTYFSLNVNPGKYTLAVYRNNIGVQLGNNTLEVTALDGTRTGSGGKGDGPSSSFIVGPYDSSHAASEPITNIQAAYILAGESLDWNTAISSFYEQNITCFFKIFKHGNRSEVLASYPVATNEHTGSFTYQRWKQFSVTPDLPLGKYSMGFTDEYGNLASMMVDLTIGIEEDGVLFEYDGQSVVTARSITKEIGKSYEIPSTAADLTVNEVGSGFLNGFTELEEIIVPENITRIGASAFDGTINLRRIFMRPKTPPFENSQIFLFGARPGFDCYVDADVWSAYKAVFKSDGNLYALISKINLVNNPTKQMNIDDSQIISFNVDIKEHYNPNFTVESSAPDILTATLQGQSIVVKAMKQGTATVTLESAQPGVEPLTFSVKVVDPNAPAYIKGDADGSGVVDILDVVITVEHVILKNPEGFVEAAADIDGAGTVDVNDIVAIVNILLSASTQSVAATDPTILADASDSAARFILDADGSLWIDSPVEIAGIQGVVHDGSWTLEPAALDLSSAEGDADARGNLTAIAYGSSARFIPAGNHKVATLTPGATLPEGLILSDPYGHAITAINASPNAITLPSAHGVTEIGRYDITGRPVGPDHRGITIIRFSDGSTRKALTF